MKMIKKTICTLLCVLLIGSLFAGCSNSGKNEEADEITSSTMLVAYTAEQAPFLYKDENGELTGFDVELFKNAFDSFKGDYKNYEFVQVPQDHKLGEDAAYTDENGKTYTAMIFIGAMQKNTGTANEDYNWSANIIENRIITAVSADSQIASYKDLEGAKAAVVSDTASTALNNNSSLKNSLALAESYTSAQDAFEALKNGSVNAVIIDDFSLYAYPDYAEFKIIPGELDRIEYGFAFAKNNDYSAGFNEAVYEMKSPDYGDGDTLTPLAEKYFGNSETCVFNFKPEQK